MSALDILGKIDYAIKDYGIAEAFSEGWIEDLYNEYDEDLDAWIAALKTEVDENTPEGAECVKAAEMIKDALYNKVEFVEECPECEGYGDVGYGENEHGCGYCNGNGYVETDEYDRVDFKHNNRWAKKWNEEYCQAINRDLIQSFFDDDGNVIADINKDGKTTMNENQKITLTFGQLKRLVKEGRYGPNDPEYEQYGDYDNWGEYGSGRSSDFSPMSLYREVKSCINVMDIKEPTTDEIVNELKKDEYGYTVNVVGHSTKRDVIAVKNEYDEYCKVEVEFDPYDWFVERISKQTYNRLIKSKGDETRIDENQKITLTVGQLKKLVKESGKEDSSAKKWKVVKFTGNNPFGAGSEVITIYSVVDKLGNCRYTSNVEKNAQKECDKLNEAE